MDHIDTTATAALRLVIGIVETDEAARLRKELAALKARVGEGEPDRPLGDDDVLELEHHAWGTRRVLVRHLPTELRALCGWLAEGCTHTGQRFKMINDPDDFNECFGIDLDTNDAFEEAVAQVAGVEPIMRVPDWAEPDAEEEPDYGEAMLNDSLSVGQGVYSFAYVAAWAVQNRIDPALLVEPNWVLNIGIEFVKELREDAITLFGIGTLLQDAVHARKKAGKSRPNRVSIRTVCAAARVVHETLIKASAQLEELAEQGEPDSPTRPVAGDWGFFQGYGDEEYAAYRRAPRFVLVADPDSEERYSDWHRWERACEYFSRV